MNKINTITKITSVWGTVDTKQTITKYYGNNTNHNQLATQIGKRAKP